MGPLFSKEDGGRFDIFTEKFDYQRQSGSQGYNNKRICKKMPQGVDLLQQNRSRAKETHQTRGNLFQKIHSPSNYKWKFTRNNSHTPVKGLIANGIKFIFI